MFTNNIIQFPTTIENDLCARARKKFEQEAVITADKLTELDVWQALEDNRIELHYQPQYDLQNNQMVAAEALVRLLDRDGTIIMPDRFIEMTENSALIVPLGRRVIEQACRDMAYWRKNNLAMGHVAINLSASQLETDSGLVDFVSQQIIEHQLDWSDLVFELTERQHLDSNTQGMKRLVELSELGARIVLDDFGIGYASNMYLIELPVSGIKIDLAMVQRITHDPVSASIVRHLIDLAANLQISLIAEGIESLAQHKLLTEFGCPVGQGFLYAKPISKHAILDSADNLEHSNITH